MDLNDLAYAAGFVLGSFVYLAGLLVLAAALFAFIDSLRNR